MYKVMHRQTFKAVCFLNISFDLNITAEIQIVTKKPAHQTILPLVGTQRHSQQPSLKKNEQLKGQYLVTIKELHGQLTIHHSGRNMHKHTP